MGINWKHRKVIVSIVMCVLLCVTAITAMMIVFFFALIMCTPYSISMDMVPSVWSPHTPI